MSDDRWSYYVARARAEQRDPELMRRRIAAERRRQLLLALGQLLAFMGFMVMLILLGSANG